MQFVAAKNLAYQNTLKEIGQFNDPYEPTASTIKRNQLVESRKINYRRANS